MNTILFATTMTLGLATAVALWRQQVRPLGLGLAAIALMTLALPSPQPALAAAAQEEALSEDQEALHETLRTSTGNQYEGIEHASGQGVRMSDRDLRLKIEEDIADDLKLSVSNGSVRLSGQVDSLDAAKGIVADIKALPGVHEVSYTLGF